MRASAVGGGGGRGGRRPASPLDLKLSPLRLPRIAAGCVSPLSRWLPDKRAVVAAASDVRVASALLLPVRAVRVPSRLQLLTVLMPAPARLLPGASRCGVLGAASL